MGLPLSANNMAAVDTSHHTPAGPAWIEKVLWTSWLAKDLKASKYFWDWSLSWKKCCPPLRRWWTQLLWANIIAMSHDGARWFGCTLFAQMTALNDSNASVANNTAGSKCCTCVGRWRIKWNLGLLNQHGVQCIVWRRNSWIADSRWS